MKDMIYQKKRKEPELLFNNIYRNYHYYILTLGTHPTAYIEITKNSNLYLKKYYEINLNVHGGLTFSGNNLRLNKNTIITNSWFIGWDYAHFEDFTGIEIIYPKIFSTNGKKWSTEEIRNECENVIDEIIEKYDMEY